MAVTAIIGLGIAAYQLYNGIRKDAKAKQLNAQNKRPIFAADGAIQDVVNIATGELQSDREKDYLSSELGQQQAAGIDAILKSGGTLDFETANQMYGRGLRQGLQTIMASRDRRVINYNNAAYNKAQSKDTEFQYNKDAPYKDNKQLEASLAQQSAESISAGLSGIVSSASSLEISSMKPGKVGGAQPATETAAGLRTAPTNTIGSIGPSAGAVQAAAPMLRPVQDYSMSSPGMLVGYNAYGDPIYSA